VTGVSGNTLTIVRGQGGTTAKSHSAGAKADVPGDLGGVGTGQGNRQISGTNYNIATIILPHEIDVEGATHEMGHGFGYVAGTAPAFGLHSRALSYSTTDYNDCYDLMSAYSCLATFSADPSATNFKPGSGTNFGGTGRYNTVLGEASGSKGPGLTAYNLDLQGWIPGPRKYSFNNGISNQATITLHSLGDPNTLGSPAGEYVEAQIPAAVTIEDKAPNDANGNPLKPTNPPTCGGAGYACTTSQYYTVEYRENSGWDRGISASAAQLHLVAQDSLSYWVDLTPNAHSGLLVPGDEYVDAASKAYVAVNSVDAGAHSAQVTLGSRKIDATLTVSGDTSGDFNDPVTLAADLKVAGSGAPVPLEPVVLSVGSQNCVGTSDATGHAACQITLSQHPGGYTLTAFFGGDAAYNSTTASVPFTIDKEESQVTYTGDLTADYHDQFTASATLVDPDGGAPIAAKTIVFTLGVGDTCSAATDAFGHASCSITPNQAAGTVNIVADFAGDIDYVPSSDTKQFVITREETTTTYTGPTVIAQGLPVTLKGVLLEDGVVAVPGRTLTLKVGSQSCTGTTDGSGLASCTIPVVTVPQGSQPLVASFAGDAYYLPSSDSSKTAIVFAFPSRGAFVLGDRTVAAASPSTTVTWWSHSWSRLNDLSGGAVSSSFKGFAANLAPKPPVCGGTWTSSPGNSAHPVSDVPLYMGTLVASSIKKSHGTLQGDVVKIVVVHTQTGYRPNPGHPGTGTVVATYCS
jgi:hypothetical protein